VRNPAKLGGMFIIKKLLVSPNVAPTELDTTSRQKWLVAIAKPLNSAWICTGSLPDPISCGEVAFPNADDNPYSNQATACAPLGIACPASEALPARMFDRLVSPARGR